MRGIQAAADTLGLDVVIADLRQAKDIAPAFDAVKGRADALYVCTEPLVFTNRVRINLLAAAARMPTMHGRREYVEAEGLMSYGTNFLDLFRRAAEYVDKILTGPKPADLPVEQPTKLELVVNLKTARALGIDVPRTILERADEVIE
jgi:putative ABC transport system substrate-binding protein